MVFKNKLIKHIEISRKLLAYSQFSSVFILSFNEINAQVIYTDILPDTIFDTRGEGAYFDIDDDGNYDFAVVNSSFSFTSYSHDVINRQDILAGPYTSINQLAGISRYYYLGTRYFPYALSNGTLVDELLDWNNAAVQIMGIRDYIDPYTNFCNYCYWYGENIIETTDRYMGLHFLGGDNQMHFGWMRCDVIDLGRTLVIKDYAYESLPNKGIFAGETASFGNSDALDSIDVNLFGFNNSVYIFIYSSFITPIQFSVYDINGGIIYKQEIIEQSTKINLNVNHGIYLAELTTNGKSLTKKIFIN